MSQTIPKGKVVISLHNLYVEIEHEATYPDQITDLTSRVVQLFTNAMVVAKEMNMDIRDAGFEFEFDDDDEE